MKLPIALLVIMSLAMAPTLQAQAKSRKQIRQEKKAERELKKYLSGKQALQDTTFIFVTQEILFPYMSYPMTGGYVALDGNSVRLNQMDWVESMDKTRRIIDQAPLLSYTAYYDKASGQTTVKFSCQLTTKMYVFTIVHNKDIPSELTVQLMGGKKMQYAGEVRPKRL